MLRRTAACVVVWLWSCGASAQSVGRFPDPPGNAPATGSAPAANKPVASTSPAAASAASRPSAPPESWATRGARQLTEQADALTRRGELPRALTAYSQAVVMDRTYAPAYFGLARLREAQGDLREAERIYTQAARLNPGAAQALELRAKLRYISGRQNEAIIDLAESLRRDPDNLSRLKLASTWYVKSQAWGAALAVWRRLLSIYRDTNQVDAARSAQIQVRALGVLAAESDPVLGSSSSGWVQTSLRSIARRGG